MVGACTVLLNTPHEPSYAHRESRQLLEDYIIKLCHSNTASEVQQDLAGCHGNTDVSGSVTYYDMFCVDILGLPSATPLTQDMELPLQSRVAYPLL